MWEEVGRQVTAKGGEILYGWSVEQIEARPMAPSPRSKPVMPLLRTPSLYCRLFFLHHARQRSHRRHAPPAPEPVREIASGLMYRDFITVGLLCRNVKLREPSGELVKDNWIYIQEPDVFVGRLQIFNNWSPAMVPIPTKSGSVLEYFCNEGDSLWNKTDARSSNWQRPSLSRSAWLISPTSPIPLSSAMPKTYPAYFGPTKISASHRVGKRHSRISS